MDSDHLNPLAPRDSLDLPPWPLRAEIPEYEYVAKCPPPPARRLWLPALLFLTTCASTFIAGAIFSDQFPASWWVPAAWFPAIGEGLMYSGAVMTILVCHEMGHFLQACRYGVYASLPYFIPMPLTPIGTFGAVIRMEPRSGDRKAVFDIGISGPLAGLVPTIFFLWLGLRWSDYQPIVHGDIVFGMPLLVKYMAYAMHGPLPAGYLLDYHPVAFAAWVGLLITSINLMPIGQLDGGHILYGLFRKQAHAASMIVLVLAISATIKLSLMNWWPMLGLIAFLGTRHPPSADDSVPLGAGRYVLGVLTLAFLLIGFTPVPITSGP